MSAEVYLRCLTVDDAEGYATLMSDSNTVVHIAEHPPLSYTESKAKLERIIHETSQIYMAIINHASGQFVGYIAAHDLNANICPISYAILPNQRRKGFAKAAIKKLLTLIKDQTPAEWTEARVHPENKASQATLTACDFSQFPPSEVLHDRIVYRKKISTN
jgi:RimJ/RimL family protein N-acetyltransferase